MTVAEVYRRAKRMLLGSLLPELCPSCGASSHAGFCDACRRAFVAVHDPCQRCGLARPVARCPADPSDWSLDAVVAPYLYCEPVSTLILDFKYRNRLSLGRAFGLLLADEVPPRGGFADRIVPVPLHRARLRERSFNQADEIATALARVLGIPLLTGGIQRHVATRSQTELGRAERQRNPATAFRVSKDLSGVSVALIDDVMTTGATVNALASACRAAGATRVEAWTVARSQPPGSQPIAAAAPGSKRNR